MPKLITRHEAAALSGASHTVIKKAVDERVIPSCTVRSRSYIAVDEVAVLAMFHHLSEMRLPLKHKRRVRRWLLDHPGTADLELSPAIVIRKVDEIDEARNRAERYARLRDEWIVQDRATKGGDPVIKGSRVGVHTLAARIADGESDQALDEDLPHIPREAREVAVQYARANPRRGRPRRA